MPRRLFVVVALLAFATACGSSGSSGPKPTPTPTGPPGQLPTVSGSAFGTKPTITFPDGLPSTKLQKSVLKPGTGPAVKAGDLLVADYLGQIWRGKVFDNSYDRHVAAGFPIGTGKVIKGWDTALIGLHAGTRALLVIPPDQGYGSQGNPQAGIKGTDTLVFVVDVVASYAAKIGGDPHAVVQKVASNLPQIKGPLGKKPSISIPRDAALPNTTKTFLVAKGHGKPVKAGLLVVQYVAISWSGQAAGSTWTEGSGCPAAAPIGDPAQPTPFDGLVGVPLGSRVLIEVPAKQGTPANTSDAVAVDIVAQPA